jgi:hypothetical protein
VPAEWAALPGQLNASPEPAASQGKGKQLSWSEELGGPPPRREQTNANETVRSIVLVDGVDEVADTITRTSHYDSFTVSDTGYLLNDV